MRWAWAVAVALLWPQLAHLGGVGARREPKGPRQPRQRLEPPNATAPNSEGYPAFHKVTRGPGARGWGVRALAAPLGSPALPGAAPRLAFPPGSAGALDRSPSRRD